MSETLAQRDIPIEESSPKTEVNHFIVVPEDTEAEPSRIEFTHNKSFFGEHKLFLSVPVFWGEFSNLNCINQLLSFFTQKLDRGQVFEINYIVNSPAKEEKRNPEITENFLRFLRQITLAQNSSDREFEQLLIEAALLYQNDEEMLSILQLAHKRRNTIRLSYIDISQLRPTHFEALGYSESGKAPDGSMRSFGSDLARVYGFPENRDDDVFHTFDADSRFLDKHYVSDLLTLYRQTNTPYFISRAAYDSSLSTVPLAAWSIDDAFARLTFHYNRMHIYPTNGTGSPQISMTKFALQEMNAIFPMGRYSSVDFKTGRRLENRYGSDKALRDTESLPPNPVVLIKSRPYGFADSSMVTQESVEGAWLIFNSAGQNTEARYEDFITAFDHFHAHATRKNGDEHLLRSLFHRQQKSITKLQRLRRQLANQLLTSIEPNSQSTEANQSLELKRFLNQNTSLQALQPEDIEYLKFLLGKESSWQNVPLTKTQWVLREHFGKLDQCPVLLDTFILGDKHVFTTSIDSFFSETNTTQSTLAIMTCLSMFFADVRQLYFNDLITALQVSDDPLHNTLYTEHTALKDDWSATVANDLDIRQIADFPQRIKWLTQATTADV